VAAKLPGRGAWVTASASCLHAAEKKGLLARALNTRAGDAKLAVWVEELLVQRCLQLLSIGRRGGVVLGGGGKIRAAGKVRGLLVATDASRREARALAGDVPHDWQFGLMSGDELGSIFGRDSIAFAAVLNHPSGQAEHIEAACRRLAGFRSGEGKE